MTVKQSLIWLNTRRYSALVSRILGEYASTATIKFDGSICSGSELRQKCSNKALLRCHNFSLVREGHELFGFHDGPGNFWASVTELAFVEQLAREKVTRFEVLPEAPGPVQRICRWFRETMRFSG